MHEKGMLGLFFVKALPHLSQWSDKISSETQDGFSGGQIERNPRYGEE
jgi:hypothetical protein